MMVTCKFVDGITVRALNPGKSDELLFNVMVVGPTGCGKTGHPFENIIEIN